jgi:tRNA-dihydrouridine synthase 1
MVGGSELAFRLLCRRYGADLAYTPMINSERFAVDEEYRKSEFQTTPEDRPLVAHFSANNPEIFLQAARHVEHLCDAIDLNLGCPQRVAHTGHFGSYLLDKEDHPLIFQIVKTVSSGICIPLFVKIRLLNTVEETIELCKGLHSAGAALIAIHARYRVNLVGRSGPGARDGAAHLDQIKEIKKTLPYITIISNGNVKTYEDCVQNLEETDADGIMSAEGLLDDPALFIRQNTNIENSAYPDKLYLALEYLDLVRIYPVKIKSIIFHIRRIIREELMDFQLMEECIKCENDGDIRAIVERAIEYKKDKNNYIYDKDKELKMKEECEKRKKEVY